MKRGPLLVARLAIVLGVVGSLAGNTAWAYPNPILVGVGVFMSLVLPTSVALWKATGQRSGWQRAERAAVMGFIALAAASYTLWHAGLLLHDQGLDWVLAMSVPLAVESLVVMAARALSPQPVQVQGERASRKATRKVTPPKPKAVTPAAVTVEESSEDRSRRLARERQAKRRDRQRDASPLHSVGGS